MRHLLLPHQCLCQFSSHSTCETHLGFFGENTSYVLGEAMIDSFRGKSLKSDALSFVLECFSQKGVYGKFRDV